MIKVEGHSDLVRDEKTGAIINIDRACTCPYYVSPRTMYAILFAEKPAMVLHLLDGDVENFSM